MAEQLIDELAESLKEKVTEEIEKTKEALENHQMPPIPPSPVEVSKYVKEIIDNHEITTDEMLAAGAVRELSTEELQTAEELRKDED